MLYKEIKIMANSTRVTKIYDAKKKSEVTEFNLAVHMPTTTLKIVNLSHMISHDIFL
jgi:hypothetical protein